MRPRLAAMHAALRDNMVDAPILRVRGGGETTKRFFHELFGRSSRNPRVRACVRQKVKPGCGHVIGRLAK